jgi:hypothetical protein
MHGYIRSKRLMSICMQRTLAHASKADANHLTLYVSQDSEVRQIFAADGSGFQCLMAAVCMLQHSSTWELA